MAWSPLTMGLVSGKLEDGSMSLFQRSSFKVGVNASNMFFYCCVQGEIKIFCSINIELFFQITQNYFHYIEKIFSVLVILLLLLIMYYILFIFLQNKYSSFSWTEDETQANKDVSFYT